MSEFSAATRRSLVFKLGSSAPCCTVTRDDVKSVFRHWREVTYSRAKIHFTLEYNIINQRN
jgi:hypothetical protein